MYYCIFIYICIYHIISNHTSGAAQGGGRSFRIGNLLERLAAVIHGWQNDSADGLKGGWSCVFWEWLQWLQWSPHPTTAGCSVV